MLRASDDAQRPADFNYDAARGVWVASGSMFITPRVALGGEWVGLGTITAPGGTPRNRIQEEHREYAWFAIGRVRALSSPRAAVDMIGGAGALIKERVTAFRFNVDHNRIVHRASPAFVARVEGLIPVAKHVAIAPSAGVYFLRRADVSEAVLNLSRTRASTRWTGGIGGAFVW